MIFYFSSTGNSKLVADILAAQLSESRVISITDCLRSNECSFTLRAGEQVGFVFPVHGWRVPYIVRDFISRLTISNYAISTYTYSLCTCGDSTGETMKLFECHLKEAHFHLNASFSVIMPESYIGLPFMKLDKELVCAAKYANARVRIRKYADLISDSRGGEHLDKGPLPGFFSGFVGGFFYNHLITDSHFHLDEKKCIECGQCSMSCPVGDISWEKGKFPSWNHNKKCLTCFACLHHCPVNAISWGWFTKGKGQYYYGRKFD